MPPFTPTPLLPRIEAKFLRADLPGLTVGQIVRDLRVNKQHVLECMEALIKSKKIYLRGENIQGENRWVWHTYQPEVKPRGEKPYRNSAMPTGDQSYWAEQTRKLMTPPRGYSTHSGEAGKRPAKGSDAGPV